MCVSSTYFCTERVLARDGKVYILCVSKSLWCGVTGLEQGIATVHILCFKSMSVLRRCVCVCDSPASFFCRELCVCSKGEEGNILHVVLQVDHPPFFKIRHWLSPCRAPVRQG